MPQPTDYAVPDQAGRTALVTGANSGLGFQTSLRLAQAGARVLMACRNPEKADDALRRVQAQVPTADVSLVPLDLASLASIADAAEQVRGTTDRLDLLVNNAGVMAIPRRLTEDGFEMQFGTNHLGHFALTGHLIGLVTATTGSRVVSVASTAHRMGRMRFDDLMGERRYEKWSAYGQSKLANLLFTHELQRRLTAALAPTLALAAHPGWSATHLQTSGRGVTGGPMLRATELGNRLFSQSDAMGALPTLYAATSADVIAGGYYGPDGPFELQGLPRQVVPTRRAVDVAAAKELWRRSEELTGVTYGNLDDDSDDVLHDARVELDQWRASLRMDPLER